MPLEDWAQIFCIVFAGLWSGLLATLTTILHPIMKGMDGAGFRRFLGSFLPVARKAPFNYAMILGLVAAPTTALIASDDRSSTVFVLTAIGLALTLIGPLFISSRFAERNYDVILAWDPDDLPDDWEDAQRRYYALNWTRAVITWVALAVFIAALAERL